MYVCIYIYIYIYICYVELCIRTYTKPNLLSVLLFANFWKEQQSIVLSQLLESLFERHLYVCVCMSEYACMYMHACMYMIPVWCMHAIYVFIHVCMYVCMYVYVYACMYSCMYACMYACMYVCNVMYVTVYPLSLEKYVCMYVYIYIMHVIVYPLPVLNSHVCMHEYTCISNYARTVVRLDYVCFTYAHQN
jgi:hypothetical protein